MQWFNNTIYERISDFYLPGWRKASEGTPWYLSQLYRRIDFQCKPYELTCIMLLFNKAIWSPNEMLNEGLSWALARIEEKRSCSPWRGKLQWPFSLGRASSLPFSWHWWISRYTLENVPYTEHMAIPISGGWPCTGGFNANRDIIQSSLSRPHRCENNKVVNLH